MSATLSQKQHAFDALDDKRAGGAGDDAANGHNVLFTMLTEAVIADAVILSNDAFDRCLQAAKV